MSGSFDVSLSFCGLMVLEVNIFTRTLFFAIWWFHLWRVPGPLFKETWIPFSQEWFYQVWLKFDSWFFWFLRIFAVFLHFCYYSPLKKGVFLFLNKLESSKNDLGQIWLKLVQWLWRRSWKCKCLQTAIFPPWRKMFSFI
jgi:hypothetical protein